MPLLLFIFVQIHISKFNHEIKFVCAPYNEDVCLCAYVCVFVRAFFLTDFNVSGSYTYAEYVTFIICRFSNDIYL